MWQLCIQKLRGTITCMVTMVLFITTCTLSPEFRLLTEKNFKTDRHTHTHTHTQAHTHMLDTKIKAQTC